MKRLVKITIIFVFISFCLIINIAYAGSTDPFTQMSPWAIDKDANTQLTNGINVIIGIIQIIGIIAAVIVLMSLGIKYMQAAPGQRAEIKKNLTAYVIGVVLLVSFTAILQVVKNFTNQVVSTSSGDPMPRPTPSRTVDTEE